MKIDIHVHTKKAKAGDSERRNIKVAKFAEIIKNTDVGILAITNHNCFDYQQYLEFREGVKDFCQVWPGVELDILEGGRRAHLIVIVNPDQCQAFSERLDDLLQGETPDSFTISIEKTVERFDNLEPLYIAHYHSKKPDLSDADVEKLQSLSANPKRVLKEATNSISAGVYVNHGHNSIYGSDVHNWDNYISDSKDLPELRLPVESFEQFCLLLEKDEATIQTILDKKTKETVQLNPFGPAELIEIDIYTDINILFGSKGTGKTDILRALSKYYNSLGFKTEVYESSARKLEEAYEIKGGANKVNIEQYGVEECAADITSIKSAEEKAITSVQAYKRYYSAEETNKISKTLAVRNFTPLDEGSPDRDFREVRSLQKAFEEFKDGLESSSLLVEIAGEELVQELFNVLQRTLSRVDSESEKRFVDFKTVTLFNNLVEVFVAEVARKTGLPEKPIKTGFYEYASNRISMERCINKVLASINNQIPPQKEHVGDLGEKGKLYCQTNLKIQNGTFTDTKYTPIKRVTKTPQKTVASKLAEISKHVYSNSLFEKIAELNAIEGSDSINSVGDLALYYRHFTLNDQPYTPSNGESSMVLLYNELLVDRDIYLIDEPEKSLGNDYISEVIVPLLKERAKAGKKIVVATHDANIAVRTLPYNSIYREHDINGYNTYRGNPFTNSLVCDKKEKDNLDWKFISMKTLEGGKAAFGERGKIYGNL